MIQTNHVHVPAHLRKPQAPDRWKRQTFWEEDYEKAETYEDDDTYFQDAIEPDFKSRRQQVNAKKNFEPDDTYCYDDFQEELDSMPCSTLRRFQEPFQKKSSRSGKTQRETTRSLGYGTPSLWQAWSFRCKLSFLTGGQLQLSEETTGRRRSHDQHGPPLLVDGTPHSWLEANTSCATSSGWSFLAISHG